MISDYIGAVLLIVFAEMGDKTQFLAMAFATKYPVKKILLGIGIGSLLNHGLAMLLGRALVQVLPGEIISFVAGLMFLFFAFKSLEIDHEDIEDTKAKFGPVITVALAFFIGELGDKTQLAALGLSIDAKVIYITLLGTVTGMLITSAIGIYIGLKMGKNIPEDKLKIGACLIFLLFGIQKIYTSYGYQLSLPINLAILGLILLVALVYIKRFETDYKDMLTSTFLKQADRLKHTQDKIELNVVNMCKGLEVCNVCEGNSCLVGHMKYVLKHAAQPITEVESIEISKLKNKSFNVHEAKEILRELTSYYDQYPNEFKDNIVLRKLRHSAEMLVFNKMIATDDFNDYLSRLKKNNL